MQGERTGARRQCVLWAGPCVRSAAVRHGPGCSGRRRRGARDSASSEAPGRHVSRAASLQSPGAPRAPASVSLARSTCSLWPRCSRCGMMQSRPHSLPSRLTRAPSRGRGGVWSQRGGRRDRSDGNIPRCLPPGALAAAACTRGRAARRRRRRRRDGTRGRGAFALPFPARLARRWREFLLGLCPGGR